MLHQPKDRPTRSKSFRPVVLFLILLSLFFRQDVVAQTGDRVPTVTRATAIENAKIVIAPGRVMERGTVVLRDGLIAQVGSNIEIPYDAAIIKGDSLTVYAGFIDGFSQAGMPASNNNRNNEPVEDPANPPYTRAGIQPDRSAGELLDPSDEAIKALRNVGFTTAHVAPIDGMIPGRGTIIQLAGDRTEDMLLKQDVSLVTQFEGARGVYPATPAANLSSLRQLYREAARRRSVEAMYRENPSGIERPPSDPVHTALYPVLDGERPVFFYTKGRNAALETHRALLLQKELGFSMFLAGLSQAFELVDELSSASLPLFLTLDMPEDPEAAGRDSTSAETDSRDQPDRPYDPTIRTRDYQDVEAEKGNLKARQALFRTRYLSNAATLYEAGMRFGLITSGTKPTDIRKNIRLMIANGLPEDAALAALTIDAAGLLGLSQSLGTISQGKIANLVVTKGSYFEEGSTIEYVFVDGNKYTVENTRRNK